jgi:DNA-binding transcriptional regulator YdaS (Cro superfamily)
MNLNEYISQERGRQAALAKAIGAHAPDVSRWADGSRPIPDKYGAPIEIATGYLVTRQEMFPDTWKTIWPELVEQIDSVPSEKKTTQEMRRETDLGYRQPADSKQVGR